MTLLRHLIFLKTYSTWEHRKNSRMEGKRENKGTKRRPNTQMEQPEEKSRPWRNWCQSEFLWDLVAFVCWVLFFFFSSQRSTQTRQKKSCNASKHDDSQASELQNLSLGPPLSLQWGNNISWWLSGDLEQLKSCVKTSVENV